MGGHSPIPDSDAALARRVTVSEARELLGRPPGDVSRAEIDAAYAKAPIGNHGTSLDGGPRREQPSQSTPPQRGNVKAPNYRAGAGDSTSRAPANRVRHCLHPPSPETQ